jgi:hypothetical protein
MARTLRHRRRLSAEANGASACLSFIARENVVMTRRIWVGGLLLSLAGWASDLTAQDAPYKSPNTPAPASPVKPAAIQGPTVTLGRPIAVLPQDSIKAQTYGGILRASYQVPETVSGGGPSIGAPGVAVGRITLPSWPDVEGDSQQATDFATDRLLRPRFIPQRVGSQPIGSQPMGLLGGTFPQAARPAAATVVQTGLLASVLPPIPAAPETHPQMLPDVINDGSGCVTHDFWAPGEDIDPLRPHFYLGAEYLYWWQKADHVPALVTTSDPNNVNPNGRFGFIGQPGTQTLFGDGPINGGGSSGVRLTAGYWLDMYQEEGLEVSGFILGGHGTKFQANSSDTPVLARPFFNLNTGSEFSELVAFPGISTGSVAVNTTSQLWGIEGNLRCNVCCDCNQRIDIFGGFRFLDLQESITIVENINGLASAPAPFTNQQATVFDRFATRNGFYGGQLGANYEYRMGQWFVDVKAKLGIGVTNSVIDINGAQTFFNTDGSVKSSTPGGLLALNSNIGHYNKDHFSFVPELGLNLGYQVNDNIRVFAGYNFLYWTGVMRPGDQIDRNLDVTRIPNFPVAATPLSTVHPAVPFKSTDFWAQGINIGIEFRY